MDYRKKARDLANLLGHTSVDYHNKSIAIDFITEALKETVNEVNTLNIARVVLPTDKEGTLCEHAYGEKGCRMRDMDLNCAPYPTDSKC